MNFDVYLKLRLNHPLLSFLTELFDVIRCTLLSENNVRGPKMEDEEELVLLSCRRSQNLHCQAEICTVSWDNLLPIPKVRKGEAPTTPPQNETSYSFSFSHLCIQLGLYAHDKHLPRLRFFPYPSRIASPGFFWHQILAPSPNEIVTRFRYCY